MHVVIESILISKQGSTVDVDLINCNNIIDIEQ